MERFFQNLANIFYDKLDLVDDLAYQVNALSQTDNDVLMETICRLEETNAQMTNEDAHLQASIAKLHVEYAPLQEYNNRLFYEYHIQKENYDSLQLQFTKKDETIQGLLVCKQNLEAYVY